MKTTFDVVDPLLVTGHVFFSRIYIFVFHGWLRCTIGYVGLGVAGRSSLHLWLPLSVFAFDECMISTWGRVSDLMHTCTQLLEMKSK